MDPVSTTASVFTLLEAANKVRKTLIRLRHAPDKLLALNNEVTDLQLCIEGLKELDQQLKEMEIGSLGAQFCQHLTKIEDILLDLDKFVAYELTKIDRGHPVVDRSVWLRSEKKIDRFKAQVKECKNDLDSIITKINLAVRIGMTFAPCGGPELLLRFPRLRPAGSKWFELVRLGDIGSMQIMLAKGEASVLRFVLDLEAEDDCCRVYEASIYEIWGKTQLHMAYIRNDPSFWKMLSSAKKPEIEETDATREDLLQMAAGNGDIHLVRELLDWGLDPNRQDNLGQTSLHFVCHCLSNASGIIELLLERGALIKKSHSGHTPLDLAILVQNLQIAKNLLEQSSEFLVSSGPKIFLPRQTFWSLAEYSSIEILDLFFSMDILVADIEDMLRSTYRDWTAIDCIKDRRFSNREWSSWVAYPPDKNPSKIYYAFKALIRKIFKRSTGKDAKFHWNGENWIALPVEEGDEDAISEDEFCFDENLDEEEEDVVYTTDEECSEEEHEDDRAEEDDAESHSGDESGENEEEKWEDAPES
ncbi:MAG: hypothetical protein Q9214_000722 [Letrouitia sp. 1 TL-2023]